MLITLRAVGKSYGSDRIFENVNLVINKGDRIALIGVNGAGKSTLLNMISGELSVDTGDITKASTLQIGYFKQSSGLNLEATIGEEMRGALSEIYSLEKQILEAGEKLSEITDHESDAYHQAKDQYNHLQAQFEAKDGYSADVRVNTILTGMGFGDFARSTIISTLSGGERTRLALAKLLLEAPELLILDEATNHLDFRMLMWLENFLSSYKGAIIGVSHDRYFLDRVTNITWEIEERTIISYPASYSKYLTLKADRLERMQKEYDFRMSEIARFQDYHDRNIVRATTASSAKSRLRMIEHLDDAPAPAPPPKPPFFNFVAASKPVKDVLAVSNLCLSVGSGSSQKKLFENFAMQVTRGERIAIIGENGIGKSSLLKALVGKIAAQKGEIVWGRNTTPAYFDQEDTGLHMEKSALDELWDRYPKKYEQDIRNLLGSLRLSADDVYKKVKVLSGGERAKLKLGIVIFEQGNIMVMDEPTNHLDIMAKEALDTALRAFEGTLIVVSHDRYLLNHLPTRIIEVFSDRIISFSGGFDAYIESGAGQKQEPAQEKTAQSAAAGQYYKSKKQRSEEVAAKKQFQKLEQDISTAEQTITQFEQMLADPANASDYVTLAELSEKLGTCKIALDELYEQWEQCIQKNQ